MKNLGTKEFKQVLQERNKFIKFGLVPYSEKINGWIGGNIPKYFLSEKDFIESNSDNYYFYLSLINPFDVSRMFSVFLPKDWEKIVDCMIYKHKNCSIIIKEHIASEESDCNKFTNNNWIKHGISKGILLDNFIVEDDGGDEASYYVNNNVISEDEAFDKYINYFIKFGGTPYIVHDENYHEDALNKYGLELLFQICESLYCNKFLIEGTGYPFGLGEAYIYANTNDTNIKNLCFGYWIN